jgi:hypothetical protein
MPKIVTYKQLGFSELGNNLSRSMINTKSKINGGNTILTDKTSKQQQNGILTTSSEHTSNAHIVRHSPFAAWSPSSHMNGTSVTHISNGCVPIAEVQPNARVTVLNGNKNISENAL